MIQIETVDLTARGLTLPSDRVGMVIAQPRLGLTPEEPFRCRHELRVQQLAARSGPRQFILSTCDDRLFQLARQKFRHLGSRAAFYAFLSSGKDGPQIECLATS